MNLSRSVKVVHLLPHLGGGVGTVLNSLTRANLERPGFEFEFLLLESVDEKAKAWLGSLGIRFKEAVLGDRDAIFASIKSADVLHVHWWNHPGLTQVLNDPELPEARTVLWSHVNGSYVPQVFYDSLLTATDKFVAATPLSLRLPIISNLPESVINERIRLVQSNAGPLEIDVEREKGRQVHVGYIGTVDYSKMHEDFVDLWTSCNAPSSRLVVCGGPSDKAFKEEISQRECAERFEVRGHVANIEAVFRELDILFYPLSKLHYGTGEQVLIEAMSAGVVPVVFDNGVESHIVENNVTGIVAADGKAFVRSIERLLEDSELRATLSRNAKRMARQQFSLDKTVSQWHKIYHEVLSLPKRKWGLNLPAIPGLESGSAAHLFVTSYGDGQEARWIRQFIKGDRQRLPKLPGACYSATRGSATHYLSLDSSDKILSAIAQQLEKTPERQCPCCGNQDSSVLGNLKYATFDDLDFNGESDLSRCTQCGFVYNDLYFSESDLDRYYRENAHYSESKTGGSGGLEQFDLARYAQIWHVIEHQTQSKDISVLDIGCGKGGLLRWLKQEGVSKCAGVESSIASRNYIHERTDIEVVASLDDLDGENFDVIIVSHVLEHILNVSEFLSALKSRMHDASLVYIEVPDSQYYLKETPILNELYFEHINHFTARSLQNVCELNDLSCLMIEQKRFSPDQADSVPCLYALCVNGQMERQVVKEDVCPSLNLEQIMRQKEGLIRDGKPLAFWGISQYMQLLLGSFPEAFERVVGLYDGSKAKIGRTINGIAIMNPEQLNELSEDVLLVIPEGIYADEMERHLGNIEFQGECVRI